MKYLRWLLPALLLACLLLPTFPSLPASANPGYEDYTTYTEVESGSNIVVSSANVTVTHMNGNATSYVLNSEGWGWSLEGEFSALPDPPTNVQASDGTYTDRVHISWTPSADATGYKVNKDSLYLADIPYAEHTDTFYPSGTQDGFATFADGSANLTWSQLVSSDATSSLNYGQYNEVVDIESRSNDTDKWTDLSRGMFFIDTSSLPDNAIIQSATFSVYGYLKQDNLGISPNMGLYNTTSDHTYVQTSDFVLCGATALSDTLITYNGFSIVGYNSYPLNTAGLSEVNIDGLTRFTLRNQNYDVANNSPSWSKSLSWLMIYYSEQVDTSKDPKLDVTYLLPVTVYDDYDADPPTITPGTALASSGTYTDKVAFDLFGDSANDGASSEYYVIAYNNEGDSAPSDSDTGYCSPGELSYQWQVLDSESYVNIDGATTTSYDYYGAPAPTITQGTITASDGTSTESVILTSYGASANLGETITVRCVLNADGATQAISTTDEGNTGVGGLNRQWNVSAADFDENYSPIAGATTNPYYYMDAPIDGSGRYFTLTLAADGAADQTSLVDTGYRNYIPPTLPSTSAILQIILSITIGFAIVVLSIELMLSGKFVEGIIAITLGILIIITILLIL